MDQVKAFWKRCSRPFKEMQLNFTSLNKVVFVYLSIRIFVDGMEEYLIQPTAWYYMKYLREPQVFLGLTLAAFATATVLFAPFIGMFDVKFHASKAIIVMSGPVKLFGNLLYSIPVNGYFPLCGRFISGIGEAAVGVLYGAVAKCTTTKNRAGAFLYIEGLYSLGAIFGPTIGSLLIFNVNILGWKINAGNSPGVVLATVWFFLIILSMFLPSDLAEGAEEEEAPHPNSEKDSDDENNTISEGNTGCIPASTVTVCFLYYLIFLNMVFYNVVSFYTPLLAVYRFGLGLIYVKLVYLNCSLVLFISYITSYLFLDKFSEKTFLFVSLVSAIIPLSITFYFSLMWNNHAITTKAGYLLLISMIIMSAQYVSFALACSLLSKITPTERAAFYQSLVFAMNNIGIVTARVIGGATFAKTPMTYICVALAIAWAFAVIWMAFEYKNLPPKA